MNLTSLMTLAVLTFTPPQFSSPVISQVSCQSATALFATAPKELVETKLVNETMVAFVNGLVKLGMVEPDQTFDAVYLFADSSDDSVFVVLVNNDCIVAAGWIRGVIIRGVLKEANGS